MTRREDPKKQAALWWSLIQDDPGELVHAADFEEVLWRPVWQAGTLQDLFAGIPATLRAAGGPGPHLHRLLLVAGARRSGSVLQALSALAGLVCRYERGPDPGSLGRRRSALLAVDLLGQWAQVRRLEPGDRSQLVLQQPGQLQTTI